MKLDSFGFDGEHFSGLYSQIKGRYTVKAAPPEVKSIRCREPIKIEVLSGTFVGLVMGFEQKGEIFRAVCLISKEGTTTALYDDVCRDNAHLFSVFFSRGNGMGTLDTIQLHGY